MADIRENHSRFAGKIYILNPLDAALHLREFKERLRQAKGMVH